MALDRDYYYRLRSTYAPKNIKLVVVAESPPASGKYFYDPTGSAREPLFAALMKQLGFEPSTKEAGLRYFQERGWLLVDATYQQVDKLAKDAIQTRDEVIASDYPLLLADLSSLLPDRTVPLVLIKANICRILEPRLGRNGFKVINGGQLIYFPSTGQQKNFEQQFAAVLTSAGLAGAPAHGQNLYP
jgi:hypothetical protein